MLSIHISYCRGGSYCMPHLRFKTKITFCSRLLCPCYYHGKFARFLLFDHNTCRNLLRLLHRRNIAIKTEMLFVRLIKSFEKDTRYILMLNHHVQIFFIRKVCSKHIGIVVALVLTIIIICFQFHPVVNLLPILHNIYRL